MENLVDELIEKLKKAEEAVPKDISYSDNLLKVYNEHIQLCEEEIKRQNAKTEELKRVYAEKRERNRQREIQIEKLEVIKKCKVELFSKLYEEVKSVEASNEKLLEKKNESLQEYHTVSKNGINASLAMNELYSELAEKAPVEIEVRKATIERLQKEYNELKAKVEAQKLILPHKQAELEEIRKKNAKDREELNTLKRESDKIRKKLKDVDIALKIMEEDSYDDEMNVP